MTSQRAHRLTTETTISISEEELLAIPKREFMGLRNRMSAIGSPIAHAAGWATTFVGVGVGGFISLATIYLTKPEGATLSAVLLAILWCVSVGCVLLAVFMQVVTRDVRRIQGATVKSLCEDMDGIVERHERKSPAPPRDSISRTHTASQSSRALQP